MRSFSFQAPADRTLITSTLRQLGLGVTEENIQCYTHPPEDYWRVSSKLPIFAVADGVALEHLPDGSYPNPSGAAAAAREFCIAAITEAERRYAAFTARDLTAVFQRANEAVGEVNRREGRSNKTSNFWDFDLFATTGAIAVIKGQTAYWATMCDSYVAHFDQRGNVKFQSPDPWQRYTPPPWSGPDVREKKIIQRKIFRNGLNRQGKPIGYGVATGEVAAERYLNIGTLTLGDGDVLLLLTDGFAPYLELPEFRRLLTEWPPDRREQLSALSHRHANQDPERFGHERTLVAITR